MSESYKKIIEDIESSIKLRSSQKAILKVIENSFESGEFDSAAELTDKLGSVLKAEDRKKLDTSMLKIKLVSPVIKTSVSKTKPSPSDVQGDVQSESGSFNKEKAPGDILETRGEVVELVSPDVTQELVIDEQEFLKSGEYDSLGVDLVPKSEKSASIEIGEASIQIGDLSSGKGGKSSEDYGGAQADLVPETEKLSNFLDKLNKEVKSFAGAGELDKDKDESEEVTDDDIEKILDKSSEADAMLMIEDDQVGAKGKEGKEGKGSGKDGGPKMEEKPLTSPDVTPALNANSIASSGNLVESPSLPNVSTPGQIQFEYAPIPVYPPYDGSQIVDSDKMGETMGDGKAQTPHGIPPLGGMGGGQPKDELGSALKEALKESLSGVLEDAISGFKDDNKELYDAVERKKKEPGNMSNMLEESKAMSNLLEEEEEYDEGRPWMREAKDTDVKVHSFGDTKDESVGKYDIGDDEEEEVDKFKDVNKNLFEDVEKKDRKPKSVENEVKEAFDDVDNVKVETKTNTDGAKEIVFTNLGRVKKRKGRLRSRLRG